MERSEIEIRAPYDRAIETDCDIFWLITHEYCYIDEEVRSRYREVLKLYIANKLSHKELDSLKPKYGRDLFGKDLAKLLRNKCHYFWGYEIKGAYVYVKENGKQYAFGSFLSESNLKNAVVKMPGSKTEKIQLKSLKAYSDVQDAKKKYRWNVSLTFGLALTIIYMFYNLIAQIF